MKYFVHMMLMKSTSPTITASGNINTVERENLDVIEDDSEAKNDEVPMDNDVVIEKDDRLAEKKNHDLKPPCFCEIATSKFLTNQGFTFMMCFGCLAMLWKYIPFARLQMKTVAETLPVSIFFQIL